MEQAIFPLFYGGPIAYYAALLKREKPALIEVCEHFTKQTYRNRIHIYSSHGLQKLTIPVEKNASKMAIKDLKIAYAEKWNLLHWRAIVSSYQSSPYFEYYDFLFEPLYTNPSTYLIDQNLRIHQVIEKCLGEDIPLEYSKEFKPEYAEDFRNCFLSKGENKHDKGWKAYQQVFSYDRPFLPNLSILDAIFNLGPETMSYLRQNK